LKLIAYILSIYFVFLLTFPCVDKQMDIALNNTTISEYNHTDKNCKDLHLCPPFCVCNCCSTVIEITNPLIFSKPLANFVENFCFYKTIKISTLFFSIWQPPKL